MRRNTLLISIPAAVLWMAAAFFLCKWTVYWLQGNLGPGSNTSGGALFAFFLACALATGFGLFATARAWRGKSNAKWQALSLVGAFLVVWAVAGD